VAMSARLPGRADPRSAWAARSVTAWGRRLDSAAERVPVDDLAATACAAPEAWLWSDGENVPGPQVEGRAGARAW